MNPSLLLGIVIGMAIVLTFFGVFLALTEAKRLARHNPGESFEILQCVGITTMTEPHTFWVDGVIPPHVCAMHRIMDDTCVVCGKSLA